MLRVLATIRNSQYASTLKDQQKDLGNWVREIHDGMFAVLVSGIFSCAVCVGVTTLVWIFLSE